MAPRQSNFGMYPIVNTLLIS